MHPSGARRWYASVIPYIPIVPSSRVRARTSSTKSLVYCPSVVTLTLSLSPSSLGLILPVLLQEGLTALHLASERGDTECVELLLARESPVNVAQRSGWGPLHHASHRGHLDVVRLLLKHGAAVDATTQAGWRALHLASGAGSSQTVGVLLAAGSLPDCAAQDGSTALHCAVKGRAPVPLPPIVRRQIAPRKKTRAPRCAPQPLWVIVGRQLTMLCRPVCNPGGGFAALGKPVTAVTTDPALKARERQCCLRLLQPSCLLWC